MKLSLVLTDTLSVCVRICVCACTSYLVFSNHLRAQQPRAVSMSVCVGWTTLWSPRVHLPGGTLSSPIIACWLKPNPNSVFNKFHLVVSSLPILNHLWIHSHTATHCTEILSETHTQTFLGNKIFCIHPSLECTLQYNAIWARSHTNKLFIFITFTSKNPLTFICINRRPYIHAVTER